MACGKKCMSGLDQSILLPNITLQMESSWISLYIFLPNEAYSSGDVACKQVLGQRGPMGMSKQAWLLPYLLNFSPKMIVRACSWRKHLHKLLNMKLSYCPLRAFTTTDHCTWYWMVLCMLIKEKGKYQPRYKLSMMTFLQDVLLQSWHKTCVINQPISGCI